MSAPGEHLSSLVSLFHAQCNCWQYIEKDCFIELHPEKVNYKKVCHLCNLRARNWYSNRLKSMQPVKHAKRSHESTG